MSGYRLLSHLLQYPHAETRAGHREVEAALAAVPAGERRDLIAAFVAGCAHVPLAELQAEYVATFDFDRRASLYLTYHSHGDRRQRGIELVRLKRRFVASGFELADGELPDYLPALLEFAALAPDGEARQCSRSCGSRSSSSAAGSTSARAATGSSSTRSWPGCRT